MLECDYTGIDYETLKNEDRFERYKYLSKLEKLISAKKNDCFVLQISGQYGSGKTFFVNLLDKYLKEQGYKTLYYNAWEHDYAQDAFVSFCSMFVSHFDASTPDKDGFKAATTQFTFTERINCFRRLKNLYKTCFMYLADPANNTSKINRAVIKAVLQQLPFAYEQKSTNTLVC